MAQQGRQQHQSNRRNNERVVTQKKPKMNVSRYKRMTDTDVCPVEQGVTGQNEEAQTTPLEDVDDKKVSRNMKSLVDQARKTRHTSCDDDQEVSWNEGDSCQQADARHIQNEQTVVLRVRKPNPLQTITNEGQEVVSRKRRQVGQDLCAEQGVALKLNPSGDLMGRQKMRRRIEASSTYEQGKMKKQELLQREAALIKKELARYESELFVKDDDGSDETEDEWEDDNEDKKWRSKECTEEQERSNSEGRTTKYYDYDEESEESAGDSDASKRKTGKGIDSLLRIKKKRLDLQYDHDDESSDGRSEGEEMVTNGEVLQDSGKIPKYSDSYRVCLNGPIRAMSKKKAMVKKEAFLWFIGEFVESVTGRRTWGKMKFSQTASQAKDPANGKLVVTVSDEALALLLFDNYSTKWFAQYDDLQNKGRSWDNRPPDEKMKRGTGKFTYQKNGQSEYGGWSKEGIAQYNRFWHLVKRSRQLPDAERVEMDVMQTLKEQHPQAVKDYGDGKNERRNDIENQELTACWDLEG